MDYNEKTSVEDRPPTSDPNWTIDVSEEIKPTATGSAVKKAEEVVSTMLAKGFILGKEALCKVKSFDEMHHITSNASATVASIDLKIGLSEKLGTGAAVVNIKVRGVDERFKFSEKAKSAIAAAEQTASIAGSAILSNHYVSTGASWVSSAFDAVAKAAEGVTVMTKEKVERAEEEKQEALRKEQEAIVNELAHIRFHESSVEDPPLTTLNSEDRSKLI